MEKIWYDPHEKSPRVDRILSQMSNLQTFELTQRVKAILQDKKKISPIPDIWRLRKQKNQSFFPEIGIQLKIELFEPEDSNFEVNIPRKRVSSKDQDCPDRPKFKCSKCDKSFAEQSRLDEHVLECAEKPIFKCSKCDKSFKYKQSLKNHLKMCTNPPVKCSSVSNVIKNA